MYDALREILRRPAPFEATTTEDLWCDEHTSAAMLEFHLDGTNDFSSRRTPFLDRSAAWIAERFDLGPGRAVLDLGCGPGHYTTRLAQTGARIVGVDFSDRSVRHARERAAAEGLQIEHRCGNYLEVDLEPGFDLAHVIMCDVCALGPAQRSRLFQKVRDLLRPQGAFLFDVYSLAAFEKREETSFVAENLLDGFWSARPYVGFLNTFKYEAEKVVLDKYTIVEEARTRTVLNWLQYFDLERLAAELDAAGLRIADRLGDVAGAAYDPESDELAVIAVAR